MGQELGDREWARHADQVLWPHIQFKGFGGGTLRRGFRLDFAPVSANVVQLVKGEELADNLPVLLKEGVRDLAKVFLLRGEINLRLHPHFRHEFVGKLVQVDDILDSVAGVVVRSRLGCLLEASDI